MQGNKELTSKLETWAELTARQRERNDAEKRALIEAAARQENHRQLAAYALGITENTFRALAKRLCADLGFLGEKRGRLMLTRAKIEDTAHMSQAEAARTLGFTGAAICQARKRYGIKSTKENDQ